MSEVFMCSSLGALVSSTNITEILLKVALNTINQAKPTYYIIFFISDNSDEFLPFLTKENGEFYSPEDFELFLKKTEETAEWGGQLEVKAMSSAMHRPIEIIQGEGPSIKIGEEFGADLLTVCYHRHAFGLGEHYNSVEPYIAEDDEFSG
jgi:hypothetical protein